MKYRRSTIVCRIASVGSVTTVQMALLCTVWFWNTRRYMGNRNKFIYFFLNTKIQLKSLKSMSINTLYLSYKNPLFFNKGIYYILIESRNNSTRFWLLTIFYVCYRTPIQCVACHKSQSLGSVFTKVITQTFHNF